VLGKKALDDVSDSIDEIKTPLQEYTGSLDKNIKQNIQYKSRLSEISKELKAGTGNTAALVKEQEFLKKASAEVSQTISAQTKFIQAADGSYDQLNAHLGIARNLMRQLIR
jgi:chromosome segregation ATPase